MTDAPPSELFKKAGMKMLAFFNLVIFVNLSTPAFPGILVLSVNYRPSDYFYAKISLMGLFKIKKAVQPPIMTSTNTSAFAEIALNYITDGVLLIDGNGVVKYANPAAATMAGYGAPLNMLGLDYQLVLKLETTEGVPVSNNESQLSQAILKNQPLTTRDYLLISAQSERKGAISLTLTPTGGPKADKIITFRDITKELEEESEQSEFISTASHEMRTPVASIEGYLGLALNPQTATIDERARKYLTEAHHSSQHLGRLFKDLLDVTKLDDGRLKVHLVPVEIVSLVQRIAAEHQKDMAKKQLKYSFGAAEVVNEPKRVEPLVYAAVDVDFLREILDNLIENAIKYTPEGGEIWVNCRGDGDKVLVNVSDSGIGISVEDTGHIFQKFYRVDNSQTRSVGGTGLGLYIVKQRVEAMGGRVWVESAFGDGSTFFFSLPRLTDAEYQKRLLAYQNEQAVQAFSKPTSGAVASIDAAPLVPGVTPAVAAGLVAEMMKQAKVVVAPDKDSVSARSVVANAEANVPAINPAETNPASKPVAQNPTVANLASAVAGPAPVAKTEASAPAPTPNATPAPITTTAPSVAPAVTQSQNPPVAPTTTTVALNPMVATAPADSTPAPQAPTVAKLITQNVTPATNPAANQNPATTPSQTASVASQTASSAPAAAPVAPNAVANQTTAPAPAEALAKTNMGAPASAPAPDPSQFSIPNFSMQNNNQGLNKE